ncbi:TVP38/TMEM64 family protein [Natrinema sp. CGMCC1.2065]|uniref:TVP38/TMEM64 family protein n=1 Tax=Natrinema sp. CGMCC1.2065 TaxID=3445767 RepID=UPI003F4A23AF
MQSGRTRALAGAVVASGMVAAGLLVSPSTAIGAVDSLAADPLSFGLVVAGLYLVRPLLAWPTTPLAAVVGYGYGVAVGVPVALAGVVVTVLPIFVAVGWLAGDESTEDVTTASNGWDEGGLLERAGDAVGRYYETAGPLRGVVASRLAPIPSDVATCAAAVSDVSLRWFLVGTAVGELPWTIAAVVVGASAATATAGGIGDAGLAVSLAGLLAACLLLAGPAYRTLRSRDPLRTGNGQSTDN